MNSSESNQAMPASCPQCGAPLPAGALGGLCPACLLKEGAAAETGTQPAMPPFKPPSLAELAQLFPQLQVLELLGKGGMGAVYKARQPALERFVALKILPARDGSKPAEERFTREARALARLSHPNIVAVHEFGHVNRASMPPPGVSASGEQSSGAPETKVTGGGLHCFIMEYVDGVNLRQLERTRRLAPREALQLIPQICDALQYAHDEGVVHRDIKPENVLVDRKGRVKIADFGLAKILGRPASELRLTGEGQVMGTPHYMAPEQVERPLEVDHRADIFSLGVVFYEMLTGELPLGQFPLPSRKVQVDVRFDEVVLHALEKEPARRYQQASEVKTAVEYLASPRGTGAPPAQAPVMVPLPRAALGFEFKSKASLFGLPLLHVASGVDPATGERRVAKGIFAFGNVAFGLFAAGGLAVGGIALGGCAVGVVGIGGFGLGLLALGGLAVGLGWAVGGGAIAPVAFGGGSAGYWAIGGSALGAHSVSSLGLDPVAWDFFQPWIGPFLLWFIASACLLGAASLLVFPAVQLWSQRHALRELVRDSGFWTQALLSLFGAAFCLVPCFIPALILKDSRFDIIGRARLVSGTVSDAQGAQPIPGAQVAVAEARGDLGRGRSGADGKYALIALGDELALTVLARGYEPARATVAALQFNRDRHAALDVKLQRTPDTSQETWRPDTAAGQSPDLNRILQEGRDLMQRGAYDEALQRFIWYHNHLREFGASSPGAGIIYVLSEWVELGRRYPKAKQALLEIRDQKAGAFLNGGGYFELFMELGNVNQYLQDDENTFKVFQHIEQSDPALAKQCFHVAEPLLVKHRLYQRCLQYMGEPQAAFDRIRSNWEALKGSEERWEQMRRRTAEDIAKRQPNLPRYEPPPPPKSAGPMFVGQTCQLIEILVGAGRKADAQKIQDQAVALVDDPRLKSAVADADQKIGTQSKASGTPER